jgi:hypothetical protein
MALIFFGDPTVAVECAVEIAQGVRAAPQPHLELRTGVHSGPVYRVADINRNLNVSGGGINIAHRVMDAGDAGHILVSAAMAEVLSQLGAWKKCLVDFGEHPVKHGVKLHFYNLCDGEAGNPSIPSKWQQAAHSSRQRGWLVAALSIILLAAIGGGFAWRRLGAGAKPELGLDYAISVQRYKDQQPYREPFQLAGEMLFEEDYRIALNVSSHHAGYLYILNDGPLTEGSSSINVLYPAAGASALLPTGLVVRFPEHGWIVFDRQAGTEKIYLVWSASAVAELETTKDDTASIERGHVVLRDPVRLASLREWLQGRLLPASGIVRDEQSKRTLLRSNSYVLVHLIRLEHH